MKKYLFLIAVMLLSLNMKAVEVDNIYIAGDALPSGWTNENPEIMTLSDAQNGIFVWSGNLTDGKFKFLLEKGHWTNCLNASTQDELVVVGGEHPLTHVPNYFDDGYDYPFQFAGTGVYTITVYTKEMLMVIKKKEDAVIPAELWITGSAIPNNTAKLTEDPTRAPGKFRYHGELKTGTFKIMNTPTVGAGTKYYTPSAEDANVVDFSTMLLTDDANASGWSVTVADGSYKIKINAISESLEGAIFVAREDLFIVGGATEIGWDSGLAIRLEKDLDNPNLFIFSGVLKEADSGEDKNSFKLLGQNNWGPVAFHPLIQGEALLESKYIFENLVGDHKWVIDLDKQGDYVIEVNLLEESIKATYDDGRGISKEKNNDPDNKYTIVCRDGSIYVSAQENVDFDYARVLNIDGKTIASKNKAKSSFSIGKNLSQGVYLLELSQKGKTVVAKVLINK